MVEIIWTDHAIQDLIEIGEYIENDSPKYAELTVTTKLNTPSKKTKNPNAGKIVPEFGSPQIRELICGNYRIIYRNFGYTRIDILTVHNCSRLIRNVISFDDESL